MLVGTAVTVVSVGHSCAVLLASGIIVSVAGAVGHDGVLVGMATHGGGGADFALLTGADCAPSIG